MVKIKKIIFKRKYKLIMWNKSNKKANKAFNVNQVRKFHKFETLLGGKLDVKEQQTYFR